MVSIIGLVVGLVVVVGLIVLGLWLGNVFGNSPLFPDGGGGGDGPAPQGCAAGAEMQGSFEILALRCAFEGVLADQCDEQGDAYQEKLNIMESITNPSDKEQYCRVELCPAYYDLVGCVCETCGKRWCAAECNMGRNDACNSGLACYDTTATGDAQRRQVPKRLQAHRRSQKGPRLGR